MSAWDLSQPRIVVVVLAEISDSSKSLFLARSSSSPSIFDLTEVLVPRDQLVSSICSLPFLMSSTQTERNLFHGARTHILSLEVVPTAILPMGVRTHF